MQSKHCNCFPFCIFISLRLLLCNEPCSTFTDERHKLFIIDFLHRFIRWMPCQSMQPKCNYLMKWFRKNDRYKGQKKIKAKCNRCKGNLIGFGGKSRSPALNTEHHSPSPPFECLNKSIVYRKYWHNVSLFIYHHFVIHFFVFGFLDSVLLLLPWCVLAGYSAWS